LKYKASGYLQQSLSQSNESFNISTARPDIRNQRQITSLPSPD